MKPLTLEIHGTSTHNRGAELMAIAVAERMRASFPGVRLVVPTSFGDFESRGRHGFWTTYDFPGRVRARLTGALLRTGAPGIRAALGIVDPAEVDVVVSASGFAFSDQWGPGAAQALLAKMETPQRRNQPLILLPQALGPFENPEVSKASRELFARSTLVCARDDHSFAAVEKLGGARDLRKYPDFTLGIRASQPDGVDLPEAFAAIVPNYRMLDKSGAAEGYIAFLKKAVEILQSKHLNPVFILHDAEEDMKVIERVSSGRPLPVLKHPDPRVLKGMLGKATLVVGSRFHALVSSLSQGVPCIGAGWSHKYPELFRDFDSDDLLIADLNDAPKLAAAIDELADLPRRQARITRIRAATNLLKGKTQEMWQDVEGILRAQVSSLR